MKGHLNQFEIFNGHQSQPNDAHVISAWLGDDVHNRMILFMSDNGFLKPMLSTYIECIYIYLYIEEGSIVAWPKSFKYSHADCLIFDII